MIINPALYKHESDDAALKALQAIPVFPQLLKAFMKIWNEKQMMLENMSSNLKLGENQLPKYYNMLPPICAKLGIEVPDLYLTHDVNPNAYTSGDTKPFIVITTGLLETVPDELIPTVLAHECGHIACHHVLYHTMGRMLLNGTLIGLNLLGINELTLAPLRLAFFHWMRCSEYSADRAAAICDGSADNLVKMCMAFAGFDKDICIEGNVDAFMQQAITYKQMVDEDKWNKTLEFMMFSQATHPLVAVRAYECSQWTQRDNFENIVNLSNCPEASAQPVLLPVLKDSQHYIGKDVDLVASSYRNSGFKNIVVLRTTETDRRARKGEVLSVVFENAEKVKKGMWINSDSTITITYYDTKTEAELQAEHPGEIRMPNASKFYQGIHYHEVAAVLTELGFEHITVAECQDKKQSRLARPGCVLKITIDGKEGFGKGDWINRRAVIQIITSRSHIQKTT